MRQWCSQHPPVRRAHGRGAGSFPPSMNAKLCLVAALLLSPLAAFAYVDPGSGMLLWQGLSAVIGAAVVFLRNPIDGAKRLWKRIRRK